MAARDRGIQESLPFVASDVTVLDLLRQRGEMSVAQLSAATDVTPTAVRQRLTRLMAQGYVARQAERGGRGRPSHRYRLTEAGRRKVGANFGDLAIVLWEEIREIRDPEIRRGLIQRLASRLAERYGLEVEGATLGERMESLAQLFVRRDVPFSVSHGEVGLAITALACPYPDLAEQDRTICAMEKILFGELLGESVRLTTCRLEGGDCCTFTARPAVVQLEATTGAPTTGTEPDTKEAH